MDLAACQAQKLVVEAMRAYTHHEITLQEMAARCVYAGREWGRGEATTPTLTFDQNDPTFYHDPDLMV